MIPIIAPLVASMAATNAALSAINAGTVVRIASRGHGGVLTRQEAGEVPKGRWIGVECCPACRKPITETEKWSGCCSHCGYTADVYIHGKIRAGRVVTGQDGSDQWQWLDALPIPEQPIIFRRVKLALICLVTALVFGLLGTWLGSLN